MKPFKNIILAVLRSIVVLLAFALVSCGGGSTSYTPPVNAGPGTVATQLVDAAVGGTITIQAPGNALNGTVVNLPAGALGASGTDTITIGYSDALPGSISPDALAAGATVITKSVELTHTSTTPFASVVQVTIPYDTTMAGQSGIPIIVYWDETLNNYETVQIVSFDPVGGTVTFNTKHFTTFLAIVFPQANTILQRSFFTNFNPDVNGFSVKNFSTQKGVTNDGACYGLTSFAAWFFKAKTTPLFSEYFGSSSPFISSTPIEQDVARELIYKTYVDTNYKNHIALAGARVDPVNWTSLATAAVLYQTLRTTSSPQLLAIEGTNPTTGAHIGWHSVLVYGWDAVKGNFLIYDPNDPGKANQIHFDASTGFSKYVPSYTQLYEFTKFYLDSISSHYDPATLETNLSNANNGWPSKAFNTITNIQSSLTPQPSQLPANTFAVDPSGTSTISGTVNVAALDPSSLTTMAFFYVDGKNVSRQYVDVKNGNFTSSNQLTKDIQWGPAKTSAELIIIIADANGVDLTTNQITSGYAGFFRGTLVIPTQSPVTTGKLNDTGITASQCYQAGSNVLVSCTSAGAIALNNAQDGMVGRDTNPATNSNTDGKLGFSFSAVPGGCVQDNITGLMWEVKTADGGLRDWNKTYTNYSATYNPSGLYGATTDASGFVTAVNATNLCGYSDWRLPTVDELQSIVDYGVAYPGPTIDTTWFPNTQGEVFWSASPSVGYSSVAWYVQFFNGEVYHYYSRSITRYVRLVRAGQ